MAMTGRLCKGGSGRQWNSGERPVGRRLLLLLLLLLLRCLYSSPSTSPSIGASTNTRPSAGTRPSRPSSTRRTSPTPSPHLPPTTAPPTLRLQFLLVVPHNITLQNLKRLLCAQRLEIAQVLRRQVGEDLWVQNERVLVQDYWFALARWGG